MPIVHSMKFTEIDNCPIYRSIVEGVVTVHGRKASERNRKIRPGDHILFEVYDNLVMQALIDVKITDIKQYADVDEFVKAEKLDRIIGDRTKCLNIKTESEYVKYYSNFVNADEILDLKKKHGYGFIGFHFNFIHEYRIYRKSIQDPWYDFIKNGVKTVEGRLNKSWVSELKKLDRIIFMRKGHETDHINVIVTDLIHYPTFKKMIEIEKIKNVLPGIKTIDQGVDIYRQFYSESDEKKYGVVAIHMSLLNEL